jgi:Major Facilitator Superfamily
MLARVVSGSRIVACVVAYALFIDYLIYGLLIPLIPHSPARATSEQQLGLLYGAYAIGVLTATPLLGYLGDRIGYRRSMISGVVLSATALAIFCFARRFDLLLLGRLITGCGLGGKLDCRAGADRRALPSKARRDDGARANRQHCRFAARTRDRRLPPRAWRLHFTVCGGRRPGRRPMPACACSCCRAGQVTRRLARTHSRCCSTDRCWSRRQPWRWRRSDGVSSNPCCRLIFRTPD